MNSVKALMVFAALGLAACAPSNKPALGPDGQPLPQEYRIDAKMAQEIPDHVLAQLNEVRARRGAQPLVLDAALSKAAAGHAKDMARQNRPWHWGSDGSSPLKRGIEAGFQGEVLGEDISETYENDTQTLSAWMATKDTRDVLINPKATSLGIGWYQEPEGKLWWTLVTGESASAGPVADGAVQD